MKHDDKAKITDRIRKLLAMAAGVNNEHEAAAMADKAQALLAQHNLTMDAIEDRDDDGVELVRDREIETESRPWRRGLAASVAELYFCTHYFEHVRYPTPTRVCGYVRKDIQTFIGLPHNVTVAKMIFVYLTGAVERMSVEQAKAQPAKKRTSFVTSFRHACALRLCARLHSRIASAQASGLMLEDGTKLPALRSLYDQASEVRASLSKELALTSEATKAVYNNPEGVRAGLKAGDEIGLDTQIGERSAVLIGK